MMRFRIPLHWTLKVLGMAHPLSMTVPEAINPCAEEIYSPSSFCAVRKNSLLVDVSGLRRHSVLFSL